MKRQRNVNLLLMLVLLVAVGQMAQTIYIPAIADMARDLNVREGAVQSVMGAYLLTYGVSWPDAQRVNFYLAGRAPHTPVDTASLLELLARYGYDVKPDMTPREQRRVIMAFQMHFRPTLYNGEADAETQAIAEALLEKYGQD